MDYINSLNYINSLLKFGIKPGLGRIKKLLHLMGNPQNNLKFIHVAGTNGKGSICHYVASILKSAGYKTGLFTSPFVLDFRERIQINDNLIDKSELAEIVSFIKPIADQMMHGGEELTEFEFITAVAMQWFASQKCDFVVLEVGLGGRLDATNVIETALVSVITSISLDHTNILGDSIQEIANEKCGIIKPNIPIVIYPEQESSVIDTIKTCAEKNNCNIIVPQKTDITATLRTPFSSTFTYSGHTYQINLAGKHQITNAITAIEVISELKRQGFKISNSEINFGLQKTQFIARLECISKEPFVILDGTHNPGGALILRSYLDENFKDKNLIAIIGMLKDKDVELVLQRTLPFFSKVIVTKPQNPRELSEDDLSVIAKKYCNDVVIAKNHEDAVALAERELSNFDGLFVFGSLYLASNIRPILLNYFN